MTNYRACIKGVGAYVPPKSLTNFDLEKPLDTSDEWIQQRTGIVKRHWVCLLYTSPSPRDKTVSRMPSSA